MDQNINTKIENKISEDLSPTRNLTGLHLKIVAAIAIIWTLFQLWYASPFPFWFNIGMFKGLPARAIHLGFALLLAFLVVVKISGPAREESEGFLFSGGSALMLAWILGFAVKGILF